MRLKKIEPGMIVHCKTLEEMKQLIEYYKIDADAESIWKFKSVFIDDKAKRDCLQFDNYGNYSGFCSREFFEIEGYTITEFSDLVLPELTAEEVLSTIAEICNDSFCGECYLGNYCTQNGSVCNLSSFEPSVVIDACIKWKQEHEKKEPEIETVDICRIIEVLPDGRKRCVHEKDMEIPFDGYERHETEDILKHYCMEHDGEFIAVHETVCRVKK